MDKLRKTFGKIYDRYIDKIYRFVFLKVGSKEIAEDLTSETFLRGWETFKEKQKEIENVQAFLYQIAKNLVVDYYREKNKTQIVSAEALPIADPRQNLEEKIAQNLDLERIKKALNQLNDDYQNAIIWHYLEELPIKEIAQLLEKSEGATRVLISRALNALRENIQKV